MKTIVVIGALLLAGLARGTDTPPPSSYQYPVNWSTLVTLSPNGSATMGFVLAGPSNVAVDYIVRAVGPSLAAFGVANPCPDVGMAVYDANGQPTGATLISLYPIEWPQTFAAAGAFPLTAASGDAYWIFSFTGGLHTVQVTDESGKGGAVLIEVYLGGPVLNTQGPV